MKLNFYTVGYATWNKGIENVTDGEMLGLSALRYMKFNQDVVVDTVMIYPIPLRWAPESNGNPKNIRIEAFDSDLKEIYCQDFVLPLYPKYEDKLHTDPHVINIKTPPCSVLRIICSLEHPAEPNHFDQWAREEIVPYSILDKIELYGETVSTLIEPVYNRGIKSETVAPKAPEAMTVLNFGNEVIYRSKYMELGFSLKRPFLSKFGWDETGNDFQDILYSESIVWRDMTNLFSAPVIRTATQDYYAQSFSGTVSVVGDTVHYKDIYASNDLSYNMSFKVREKGMTVRIEKKCKQSFDAIEADDFRFTWGLVKSIVGTLGLPLGDVGRCGRVPMPALFNSPGHGTVKISQLGGDKAWLQVDSIRTERVSWSGIVIGGTYDENGMLHFKKGDYEAEFDISLSPILPKKWDNISDVPVGIQRNWTTALGFRAELGGFSDNSVSCNVHSAQYLITGAVVRSHTKDLDLNDLMFYTLELSLKGGPGYGDCRELYIDSDPSILLATGIMFENTNNIQWLSRMWVYIKKIVNRIFENVDEETGQIICRELSGNSGNRRWSSNGLDVIAFGNLDGYTTIVAYEGLLHLQKMAKAVGDEGCYEKAAAVCRKLKDNFMSVFINKETGYVAGWKSADGELHDYAFTFNNFEAILCGLVDEETARCIVERYEAELKNLGIDYYGFGLPINLHSIKRDDLSLADSEYKRADALDQFGIYINGALSTLYFRCYIRVLDKLGYKGKSNEVCRQIEQSMSLNRTVGGLGRFDGGELYSHDGRSCGYEGVLSPAYGFMESLLDHYTF